MLLLEFYGNCFTIHSRRRLQKGVHWYIIMLIFNTNYYLLDLMMFEHRRISMIYMSEYLQQFLRDVLHPPTMLLIRPSQTAAFPTFAADRKEVLNLSRYEDLVPN